VPSIVVLVDFQVPEKNAKIPNKIPILIVESIGKLLNRRLNIVLA